MHSYSNMKSVFIVVRFIEQLYTVNKTLGKFIPFSSVSFHHPIHAVLLSFKSLCIFNTND